MLVSGESTLSPDLVKDPAEHKDADHGGADDDRVAEEVPRDAGQGAPQAVLLELHLGGGDLRVRSSRRTKREDEDVDNQLMPVAVVYIRWLSSSWREISRTLRR